MTIRVVVVDVDDTLYLERDYVRSGFSAVDAHIESVTGFGGFAVVAWEEFEAGARGDVFDRALARLDIRAARPIPELVEVYRSHPPRIALEPDADRFLARIDRLGLALGVITDGPGASQRAKLRALGLSLESPLTIVTDDLGPGLGKPAPEAFLRIEEVTSSVGGELAYIGDNPRKDFAAPRALGWRTVRLRRRGGLHADAPSGTDVELEVEDLDAAARGLLLGGPVVGWDEASRSPVDASRPSAGGR